MPYRTAPTKAFTTLIMHLEVVCEQTDPNKVAYSRIQEKINEKLKDLFSDTKIQATYIKDPEPLPPAEELAHILGISVRAATLWLEDEEEPVYLNLARSMLAELELQSNETLVHALAPLIRELAKRL